MGGGIQGGGLHKSFNVTIAISQPYSGLIDLEGYTFAALQLPAAMTGTSFTVYGVAGPGSSGDATLELADAIAALGAGPGSFKQIYDESGAAVTITFAQATCVGLGPNVMARLAGFRFIALKSSSSEVAARTIGVSLRG